MVYLSVRRLWVGRKLEGFDSVDLMTLVDDENKHTATEEAVDLISKLLKFKPHERLTAKEAIAHKFFDPVRHLFDDGKLILKE